MKRRGAIIATLLLIATQISASLFAEASSQGEVLLLHITQRRELSLYCFELKYVVFNVSQNGYGVT